MATNSDLGYSATLPPENFEIKKPARQVPWQIWVVVGMLGYEGIGNLQLALEYPIALYWLAAKVLFITGLLKAWKWVFVLFVITAGYHVVAFLPIDPITSLLNLLLVVLTISSRRYFFPK
jgi:hypothetical protein